MRYVYTVCPANALLLRFFSKILSAIALCILATPYFAIIMIPLLVAFWKVSCW